MAAVIELSTARRISTSAATARRLPDGPVPARTAPPQLRVIHGGRSDRAVQMRRTYLRRRLLVVTVLVLVVLAAAQVVGAVATAVGGPTSGAASAGTSLRPAATTSYDVARGDTLWSIAGEVLPGGDRRDAVARLIRANPWLDDGTVVLQAGDVLQVPAG